MLGNLIGCSVTHKKFGTGEIILRKDANGNGYITVQFEDRPVEFQYPEAFENFLTTDDPDLKEQVTQDIQIKKQEREKRFLITPQIKFTDRPTPSKSKLTLRQVVKSNIAFKCTYCDGGKIPGVSLGFNGVCSKEQIRYNIEEKGHVWCSDKDSICKKYLTRLITRGELERYMEENGSVCYESVMFRDWTAYAGYYQSGENRGTPITMKQVQAKSLAILTTREPNTPESKRIIFGVFLADESYEGDHYAEGYVTTNSKWKIALSPDEAHKMKFWKYYANENSPEKTHWGTGLFRYISDEQAVQILQDIISVRISQSDKDFAQQFLDHFCAINKIDRTTIPSPNGALKYNRTMVE